ncbi:Nn.00g074010.m01.CDS01 [Neocucurbitaria sp. VM-36]
MGINHGSMTTPASDARPHSRTTERSESVYESTRCLTSVQADVLHANLGLFGVESDGSDPGSYSGLALVSNIEQDASLPNTQPYPVPPDWTPWLGSSTGVDVVPWFPGSRIDGGPGDDHIAQAQLPLYYSSELSGNFVTETRVVDQPPYNEPGQSQSEPLEEPLLPPTSPKLRAQLDPNRAPPHRTNTTECGQCHKVFTGRYRRGNCSRHVRQQHPELLRDQPGRVCRVCTKTFNRQDARRKHEWQQHGLPDSKPTPRKASSSRPKTSRSLDLNSLDTETQLETMTSTSELRASSCYLPSAPGNIQDPSSDYSTQFSNYKHSGGFPSFLGSSQTSMSETNAGNFTNQALPQSMSFTSFESQHLTDTFGCPPSPDLTSAMPTFAQTPTDHPINARTPWSLGYDEVLNFPVSSRMSQTLTGPIQDAWMSANPFPAQSAASPSSFDREIEEAHAWSDVE